MSKPSLRSIENALERIGTVAGELGPVAAWTAGLDRPAKRAGYGGGSRSGIGDPTLAATANGRLAQVRRERERAAEHVLCAALHLEQAQGAYAAAAKAHDASYGPDELGPDVPLRVATKAEVAEARRMADRRNTARPKGVPHGEY